jgi:transposase-like protein
MKKYKKRSQEFKVKAVQRILADEPISRLSRELNVRRCVLYRWCDAYKREGRDGLRSIGRPGWRSSSPNIDPEHRRQISETRIADLERKVAQQSMLIDFLRKAFRRVEVLPHNSTDCGGVASTERSGQ